LIIGNEGSNIINGLAGNDLLTGGAGADTFVFAPGFGKDTVTDYHAGEDVVEIDHTIFADFSALAAQAADDGLGNTIITVDAGNTITLVGVTTSILQQNQSDFHFV
jgi:Ca2+-binding RTX toxin-like protein